jgi:ABC-2 type transport system permease protein
MNTQSNAMPQGALGSSGIVSTVISATWPLYWSVRRELWENRSLYIAPLAAAAVFLFGFMISLAHLPAKMRAAAASPMQQQMLIEQSYDFAALLIMATTLVVAAFYCLEALHGERRDRSILFWKSLPVSDTTTVLSKAIIPIGILPLITFGITFVLQLIMMLLTGAALLARGQSVAIASPHMGFFSMSLMLLYHLVGMHGFWYAPFYGWLLLASAWARRAAFLWATLPPIAIGALEKIAFNTTYFGTMLGYRFGGGGEDGRAKATELGAALIPHLGLGQFLFSPGLWIGLAITAAFLFAAMRLRRYRGPI